MLWRTCECLYFIFPNLAGSALIIGKPKCICICFLANVLPINIETKTVWILTGVNLFSKSSLGVLHTGFLQNSFNLGTPLFPAGYVIPEMLTQICQTPQCNSLKAILMNTIHTALWQYHYCSYDSMRDRFQSI
jgi:hypothetical protein